tara:strand:+ start:610 stop:1371 length:762 start_codon:yes stop_codon:yes gene_type:complete
MAIDMSKMRDRLNTLQTKGNGGGASAFWRPSEGSQTIRIVSPKDGDPFKDYFFHYNVGNNSGFLCPKKNFGEECAVCDFARKLYKAGDEESVKMAKELTARQRFFSPVLVRGEENLGVKIWGYGKMAYETLLNLVLNPEYGDITDVEAGTDLDLQYGKAPGQSFPQTKLTPKRSTSAVCVEATPEACKEILDSIPELETLFEKKSSADVQACLDEYLSDDSSAESSSSETEKFAASKDAASSVDKSFNDLLNA